MTDYTFMTTEENFLLQEALKKNRQQLTKFFLIGAALLLLASVVPQIILYSRNTSEDADHSLFSYTNIWFWIWLVGFVITLIFALIKVTDIRYWAIKKDLVRLQKGFIQAPLEAVYLENNDSQTNFSVKSEGRKRLYYWMDGELAGYRAGQEVEISFARYSRVIININKK
ncbi:hypothetical protein [Chitinophaga sp. Cy-1792]|uniref:hypothetical protein n=1 Tax=Chitinophaga sp. Cy-1792 TaxID=2608339 RepID=UPI00141DACF9|nr:hypothetical protein [Chitinophaga sp. Cy-1792]NIG57298.1 hypothetical protein [Chitinophaga sp. Cy-1792]